MIKNLRRVFFTLIFLQSIQHVRAQSDLTLFHFNAIGQSNEINPASFPTQKVFVAIPGLNMRLLFMNNSFSWRDLHKRTNGSTFWDFERVVGQMKKDQLLSLDTRIDLLRFGFRVGKNFFSANVSEVFHADFSYPSELIKLIYYGNAAFIGETVDLKQTGLQAAHYREFALGYSRKINGQWSAGIRLKYLYGMGNIQTKPAALSIRTDPNDYSLLINNDYVVNTALIGNDDSGNSQSDNSSSAESSSIEDYLLKQKNYGFAFNAGISYKLNNHWSFNAAVVDIGSIQWKSHVKNYTASRGNYSFSGIDLDRFINDSDATVKEVLDSIGQSFQPTETSNSYKTPLAGRGIISATYQYNTKTQFSFLLQGRRLYNQFLPSASIGVQRKVIRNLYLTGNYSIHNGRFDNLGAGIAVNGGAFQFYALCDNLIGTIDPLSNHFTQLHAGFNLIWGRNNKRPQSKQGS